MELVPSIQEMLASFSDEQDPTLSGRRAALWRAQQQAANIDRSLEDLRGYCLEALARRQLEDESEYLRGYRAGFQAILREIRKIESESA